MTQPAQTPFSCAAPATTLPTTAAGTAASTAVGTAATTPATTPAEAEFAFAQADFERVRQLIHQRAGISLQAGKQAMVYGRLSRRLRQTPHKSVAAYLHWLQAHTGPAVDAEWQAFINCLTTNLTAFFREEHHFDALADDLRGRECQPLRIWCSAASSGEEPCSIAITVAEALGSAAMVQIVASDINTQVLATAQRGVYDARARGLSAQRLRQHFLRGTGANAGLVRLKPALAGQIDYRVFNLANTEWGGANGPGAAFDIVFCRNVMIYFDADTQQQVLQRLHTVLKPGGLLFVGHAENFSDAHQLFMPRGKTVYQRV